MSPTAVPTRITIDFRDAALPSRTWILGVDESASSRLDLIAFERAEPPMEPTLRHRPFRSAAVPVDCACPDFCERDHANE